MGGINVPQIWGRLLHGVHKRLPVFRLIFQLSERNHTRLTLTIVDNVTIISVVILRSALLVQVASGMNA